ASVKFCPMSEEPTARPLEMTMEPFARDGNAARAMPVTTSGYRTPVTIVMTSSIRIAAGSCRLISVHPQGRDREVHQLDPDERSDDPAHAVDQEVAAQHGGRV